jgi:hypothetical protein
LLAGLRESAGAERFKRIFRKALDDTAKADQNLASLLLTTECESDQLKAVEKGKIAEYEEKKFSEILDDEAKSRLESRFFAADEETEKSAKRQRRGMKSKCQTATL